MDDPQELVDDMITYFELGEEKYNQAKERLEEIEDELKDLRHILELCQLSASDMIQLAVEQKALLEERREMIQQKKLFRDIAQTFQHNRQFKQNLESLKQDIDRKKQTNEAKTYNTRRRHDLANKFANNNNRIVKIDDRIEEMKESLEANNAV